MKCATCTSEEVRVLTTRHTGTKVLRLRCCNACGERWNTVELNTLELHRIESAVAAMRTFMHACKELGDAGTQQV